MLTTDKIKVFSLLMVTIVSLHEMANPKGRTARQRLKKSLGSENFSYEQRNDDSIDLLQWMKRMFDFKSKPLKIVQFSRTGRGIMTKDTLKPGTPIVCIPRDAMIGLRQACKDSLLIKSLEYLHQQDIGNHLKITAVQALCLLLIEERRKLLLSSCGTLGKWGPYIKILPRNFTHFLYWTPSTLSLLPGALREKGETICDNVKNELKVINEIVILTRKHKVFETFGIDKSLEVELTRLVDYTEYIWAWCCVNTRSVYSTHDAYHNGSIVRTRANCYYLMPFLDLLNHSSHAKTRTSFNIYKDRFEIIAMEKCVKYHQIFIHYGPHSNKTLLMEFGFMLPKERNSGDVVSLTWDEILQFYDFDTSQQRNARSLLKSYSLDTDWCFTYDGPSWSLVTSMLLLQFLQLEYRRGSCNLNWPIAFPTEGKHLTEIHELTRQQLASLCAKTILLINDGISACQKQLVAASNENDKQHIKLVLDFWTMCLYIMESSADEINSLCLFDFSLPNLGDMYINL